MRVDEEIFKWLANNISPHKKNRQRNVDIIMSYYGFGTLINPTLEELGKVFSAGSRENVRQIINENFKWDVNPHQLPVMAAIVNLLQKNPIISAKLIRAELASHGFATPNVKIQGLINLADDIFGLKDLGLFTTELEKLKRDGDELSPNTYLIKNHLCEKLKQEIKKVRTLPGQLGLAKLAYLDGVVKNTEFIPLIHELIRLSDDAITVPDIDGDWYVYDDRDNTLINASEKIFSLTDTVPLAILATNLQKSLRRKTQKDKYEYPPISVVEKWLRKSKHFEIQNQIVIFRGKKAALTPIEIDTVKYLSDGKSVDLPTFRTHLISLGYEKPHADKFITTSPLISTKPAPKKSLYSLIDNSKLPEFDSVNLTNRYETYKHRLKQLLNIGTDLDVETISRREQSILRDWLFEGKETEKCAICGDIFNVKALVTAHKKKRSLCTEEERTDPNIVFGLCKFGCDYLYEEGIIYLTEGKVVCTSNSDFSTADLLRAKQLDGRKLEY